MPDPYKEDITHSIPDKKPVPPPQREDGEINDPTQETKPPARGPRNILPIILSLALFLLLALPNLHAQLDIDIALSAAYSDNVFQLSEYDLGRWDQAHPNLDYVTTTDDLTLAAKVDLAYPIRYRWWKFIPSVTARITQNVSNPDKQRQDALFRLRVERYYWNFTALYGYYPNNYVRSYIDADGTGSLEQYGYERNLYRADLNIKPVKNATLQLHGRYDQYYYNQYWTEFDANATTVGIGARYSFPVFSLGADYHYRIYDNYNHDAEDASYESNIYSGNLRLKSAPLSNARPDGPSFYPELTLSYEERFFQSGDNWYGGRADRIYTTEAALNFGIRDDLNIKLDYSHTFRNVDSPVDDVIRAREYGENTISATVEYGF